MNRTFLNKLKSTKFLITLWCIAMVTYIVVSGQYEFVSIAVILSAAPMVYCGVNVYQKGIYNNNNHNKRDEQ